MDYSKLFIEVWNGFFFVTATFPVMNRVTKGKWESCASMWSLPRVIATLVVVALVKVFAP